jgi:hypothetical protein
LDNEELAKLAARFANRVRLLKMTEDEAAEEIRLEHRHLVQWLASKSEKVGSFVWFCDVFDHDAGAVRRAIAERKC